MRVAVVGHIEWVEFARVAQVPVAGEVAHAREAFEEPAGGGAVAAVQLARLAGACTLFTALGNDELARASLARLNEFGVRVLTARREARTRRAVTLVDDSAQRTIVTFGERLEPSGNDKLPWHELAQMDAVYFTAGDLSALQAARRARVLVASARAKDTLRRGVPLEALLLSEDDALELREAQLAEASAELIARTRGARGGTYRVGISGESGSWAATPTSGNAIDTYGCGDSFAGGLTYGLGLGEAFSHALELAARCGAACAAGRGPYEGQLRSAQLSRGERPS